MARAIKDDDLLIHVLNVGFGDSIVIELPRMDDSTPRQVGVVDCYKGKKSLAYLDAIRAARGIDEVAFVCATHPHSDHVGGLKTVIEGLVDPSRNLPPLEFWDSGFRHQSATYMKLLEAVRDQEIPMRRVSSGMEWYYGQVRITALAPSVSLRNRYSTYGVDINNASIILRLEYCEDDVVSVESMRYTGTRDLELERKDPKKVAILGADAEFDSWAKVAEEYPYLHTTSSHDPLVNKVVNLLNCHFLKVSHHGSMHSAPLDVLERQSPATAAISNAQEVSAKNTSGGTYTRKLFPHDINVLSFREVDSEVLTTDGSLAIGPNQAEHLHPGTIVAVIPRTGAPKVLKLDDDRDQVPAPPEEV